MRRIIARSPTRLEVEKAAQVAAKAFTNLPLEHWQDSFHGVADMFGTEFIVVAELDGEMVSSLICCPAPVFVNCSPVSHASVGAVGTIPERRKQGCAGAIMAECARALRKQGIWLSSLWPFSYEYYRKYGWEIGAEARVYKAQGKFFAEQADASGVKPAKPADFAALNAAYASFADRYNMLTLRGEEWWKRIVRIEKFLKHEGGNGCILHRSNKVVDAYLVYEHEIKDERPFAGVKEIVFHEPEHRRALLAWLGAEFPEADMSFFAPAHDTYFHEIPNPRAIDANVVASFQFRVTDPPRAMEALKVSDWVEGRVSFAVSDPVFEEGFEFGVEFAGRETALCKPDRERALETDIQTFSKLYSGYLHAPDALSIGRLKPRDGSLEAVALASVLFTALVPYRTWLEPG